jgi:hypothetical protein
MKSRIGKWIVVAAAVLGLPILIMAGWGMALPVAHRASHTVETGAEPARAYGLVSRVGAYPEWRPDVERVEIVGAAEDGHVIFREHGENGPILLEVVRAAPPRQLVTRIADPELPFRGEWTIDIVPTERGCRVTVTEEGAVDNPLFRFMARYIFGYDTTLRNYLDALERALAAPPEAAFAQAGRETPLLGGVDQGHRL